MQYIYLASNADFGDWLAAADARTGTCVFFYGPVSGNGTEVPLLPTSGRLMRKADTGAVENLFRRDFNDYFHARLREVVGQVYVHAG